MTNLTLAIDVYISNIKSNDPKTMLYGGEGLLFISGKVPIKTTHKKTLHVLSQEEIKQFYGSKIKYIPSHYLHIENNFYLDRDETSTLANELSFPTQQPGYKWYNIRWKHNLLNNDVILDSSNIEKDITLVIKRLYSGTADFACCSFEPDYIAQPTNPIRYAYLIDHLNQEYMLSSLKMRQYCDWKNIPYTYI